MGEVTLSMEAMQIIATAEDVILKEARKQILKGKDAGEKAPVGQLKINIMDLVEEEDKITFLVGKGQLGLALGKGARNLEALKKVFGKEVKVVEYDDDLERFVRNLFKPHTIETISVESEEDGIFVRCVVKPEDKGKAIGKAGRNINVVRTLARRHHNISELKVE
ncbi:MAG: NusA-like transcription termination signal-binding factor [Euryarchaeota archaeon]|nr:NusA-like transcription termination signal-binding factor [Euryarchaeota archaeon]